MDESAVQTKRRKRAADKLREAVQKIRATSKLRKILLICGIIAPLLWTATDILASLRYAGYSFVDQAISELFAIGAPTSGFVVPLFTVYSLLLVAFALGVWVSAGQKRALRIAALMLVGNALNGLVLWNIFPMHMRGVEATFTDTMHVALAGVGVVFPLLALGFAAAAFRKRFRFYTIGTIVMLLAPSILTFSSVPQTAASRSTPWLGLSERISTFVYLVWQVVLAAVLLHEQGRSPQIKS